MKLVIAFGIALSLVACASNEPVPTPTPVRTFTSLDASNAVVRLGTCFPAITGGQAVVRTDPDGMQTIENLDIPLGDCVTPLGTVTNLVLRLGTQAEETKTWQADLLVDWDLQVAPQAFLYLPTLKLPVHANLVNGVVAVDFLPPVAVPGLVSFDGLTVNAFAQ